MVRRMRYAAVQFEGINYIVVQYNKKKQKTSYLTRRKDGNFTWSQNKKRAVAYKDRDSADMAYRRHTSGRSPNTTNAINMDASELIARARAL